MTKVRKTVDINKEKTIKYLTKTVKSRKTDSSDHNKKKTNKTKVKQTGI